MGDKLVIGPINKGLRRDRTAFVIDNDSFPNLINAYQWRGRVLRKRGTGRLTRLQRAIDSNSIQTNGSGNFSGNILSGLESNSSVVFNSIVIGVDIFTDPGRNGILTGSTGGSGTINYATGALTIIGAPINTNIEFMYYPSLPVMGLEEWVDSTQAFPGTIGFDTKYSYKISTSDPYTASDISFYKGTGIAFHWNGQNYQQFWSTNYQSAFWATNGIEVPFIPANTVIGMQFAPASSITFVSSTTNSGGPSTITLSITNCPLIVGDYVFFNEWTATGSANANTLNFQTGIVTSASGGNPNTVTITLSNATLSATSMGNVFVPGIVQYLTNSSDATTDCIRWYDGTGWVNFTPPLSQFPYSISDEDQATYYLVGARSIVPFKDRLLFFGPVIQTSNPSNKPIYLQDTVIYSQNGTVYYTASFSGDIFNPTTPPGFVPILCPTNQTADPKSFWEDQTGFGGFISAGIDQAITTVSPNEDALIVGFNNNIQTRLVYSGNDILPFVFYIINAELGSGSVFSAVNMDDGVITKGPRGFIITSQSSCKRIDLEIPDQFSQISNLNNGSERFCSQRDFISEWIYFTYTSTENSQQGSLSYIFPNQTLLYNYRDDSWAIFNECYTTYGNFKRKTGLTWATVGNTFPTWNVWNNTWESGQSELLQPEVIAGNQEGFVVTRAEGTTEAPSLYIVSISGSTITIPNHSLNQGDFIQISGCLGTVSSEINGFTFQVTVLTVNTISVGISFTGTYLGQGLVTRFYVPFIQSKQFPVNWGLAKKTRLGPQQYLLTRTNNAQVSLYIYLSQNDTSAWNNSPIVPSPFSTNNGLIFGTVLYTCPESTNLGLTPFNSNLQQLTEIDSSGDSLNAQQQIWHRVNTSLIGDTVQFAITLSRDQMLAYDNNGFPLNALEEIEFHGAILDVSPAGNLA